MNLVLTKDDVVIDWLGDIAEHTVVLSPAATRDASDPVLRREFAGWVVTPDYHATITELLAAELVLDLAIDRVAGLGEFDVLRVARLRDLGGLPGQRFAEALRYRDKWTLRTLAAQAGAAVPEMLLVEAVGTLPHRIGEIGLPAVVRPRWMAAGAGVSVVRDFCAVTDVMRMLTGHVAPFELMVERYVDAPVFHVDGLMRGGSVMVAYASEFLSGVPGAVVLDDDDVRCDALLAGAAKVIGALGSPDHVLAFHAEFFLPEDGTPVLCDIAARAGGLGIPGMISALVGVDLRRESLMGQLGLEHSALGSRRHGSAGYVMRDGAPHVVVGRSFSSVKASLC